MSVHQYGYTCDFQLRLIAQSRLFLKTASQFPHFWAGLCSMQHGSMRKGIA